MPDIKVSVVIRSYNEEMHLPRLLEGIRDQEPGFNYETILVDSGSTDKTLDIAARFPVKVVHIKPEEFSFGYSLNKGIEAASGEFAVFISAHCYPENNSWLTQMTAPFENPKVALVYGKQRGNGTTKYSEHQVFSTWFPNQSVTLQKHPFCNNANCAIRKSLWVKDKYNESLTGLEDLAWAKIMVEKGYFLSYNADAGIIHVHDETYKQVYNRYKREAISYYGIFKDESFRFWDFLKLFTWNVWADYRQAFKERKLFENLFAIKAFRFNQFLGTWSGSRYKKEVSSQLRKIFYYPNSRNGISQDSKKK